jgi:hypothetical protein
MENGDDDGNTAANFPSQLALMKRLIQQKQQTT